MTTPCRYYDRSVMNIDITAENELYINYLPQHAVFFRGLIDELAGFKMPFASEYFVPVVYDFVLHAPDLHVLLCTNDQNVLVPVESEQPSDEIMVSYERYRASLIGHPPPASRDDEYLQLDDGTVLRLDSVSQPVNSYMDFHAKQFELSFDLKFLEVCPVGNELHIRVEAASLDAAVVLSRYHSVWLKSSRFSDCLRATFQGPSIAVGLFTHTDTLDETLTDWFAACVFIYSV